MIFSKSAQVLAFADDIDVIGRNKRQVTAALSAIECERADMGLGVSGIKVSCRYTTTIILNGIALRLLVIRTLGCLSWQHLSKYCSDNFIPVFIYFPWLTWSHDNKKKWRFTCPGTSASHKRKLCSVKLLQHNTSPTLYSIADEWRTSEAIACSCAWSFPIWLTCFYLHIFFLHLLVAFIIAATHTELQKWKTETERLQRKEKRKKKNINRKKKKT